MSANCIQDAEISWVEQPSQHVDNALNHGKLDIMRRVCEDDRCQPA